MILPVITTSTLPELFQTPLAFTVISLKEWAEPPAPVIFKVPVILVTPLTVSWFEPVVKVPEPSVKIPEAVRAWAEAIVPP